MDKSWSKTRNIRGGEVMAEAQEEALSFNPVEVGDFEEALETANKILVPGV